MADGWVDVAAPLRANAAKALVATRYTSALEEVAVTLADPESTVRAAAAEALGVLGGSGACAVLRLELELGDEDADVTGACLSALLRIDVDRYLPVVAARLHDQDGRVIELAALALGESRAPGAFAVLKAAVDLVPRSAVATVLLAIALLRREEATQHLIDLVERATPGLAAAASASTSGHEAPPRCTTSSSGDADRSIPAPARPGVYAGEGHQ